MRINVNYDEDHSISDTAQLLSSRYCVSVVSKMPRALAMFLVLGT